MNQESVVLELPTELYERIRQIAEDSNRPVETVLLESLALLFGEDFAMPETTSVSLGDYSDQQLWA